MGTETIHQALLAVLTGEATEDEHRLVNEWLEQSDSAWEEYTEIKRLYDISVPVNRPGSESIDTERAWANVRKLTTEKKRRSLFYPWLRYAAMVAVLLSTGVMLYLVLQAPDKPAVVSTRENYARPMLFLGNGEKIDLTEESFSKDQQHTLITNEAGNQLSYQAKDNAFSSDHSTKTDDLTNHLVIPKGQTYRIILSDGTEVWLNSETELIYPSRFTDNKREVILNGEAFFQVAKSIGQPFYVKTGNGEVLVTGTSFNVCDYKEEKTLDVTLVEGTVNVSASGGEQQSIRPSEQFVYDKNNGTTHVRIVNTELYTSWITGRYIFKNVALEEIVRKLGHWYDFTVSYEDESLKGKHYSLVMDRAGSIDKLLEVISNTSDIKLEKTGTNIHISKKRR